MRRTRVREAEGPSHSVTMVRNRPSRLTSSHQRNTVLDAVRQGASVTDAARSAGVARETAQRWVRAAGLRKADRHAADVERARRAAKPATPGTAKPTRGAKLDDPATLQRNLDAALERLGALAEQLDEERALRIAKDREVRELRERDPWQRRAIQLGLGTIDVLPYEVWSLLIAGGRVNATLQHPQLGARRVELALSNPDHIAALREAVNLAESMRLDEEAPRADRPPATSQRARRDRYARLMRAELYGDSPASR